MPTFRATFGVLVALSMLAQSAPVDFNKVSAMDKRAPAHEGQAWQDTLSIDTRHRLEVALKNLDDKSDNGQAFRNDTIMRVNIEREAPDLPLVDLHQAFGLILPSPRPKTMVRSVEIRSNAEDMREFAYLRGGKMTGGNKRSDAEDMREFAYLRGGKMTGANKRSDSSDSLYSSLLDRDNLALGAIERVNIAHRISGKSELTNGEIDEMSLQGHDWAKNYWNSSVKHGTYWTTDQVEGEPNFIEGGQGNGFGFVQSTYHKRHCLANLRMMLSWFITGTGSKMTDDMNVHAIHCLEYIRERELANADLNEEPIDTVDYKGMGIH
ncbi:hypothetical protein NLG97_g3827 [Lecanicillium saksenae]|uniref:Uncharacterized protein n=1 Tax=Lecanicillium saksenae TaxID=468837 RepID=A0ACC1QYV8_9HYPO|nr:hypothetical protein NLG97_g3827 [Lecanicillium saksenae]